MTLHVGYLTLINLLHSSTWMLFVLFSLDGRYIEANAFVNCSIEILCLVGYTRLLYVYRSLLEE